MIQKWDPRVRSKSEIQEWDPRVIRASIDIPAFIVLPGFPPQPIIVFRGGCGVSIKNGLNNKSTGHRAIFYRAPGVGMVITKQTVPACWLLTRAKDSRRRSHFLNHASTVGGYGRATPRRVEDFVKSEISESSAPTYSPAIWKGLYNRASYLYLWNQFPKKKRVIKNLMI